MSKPKDESAENAQAERDDDDSFVPDQDAGPTEAEKYSRDEKDHGRQDYGP
jgi:hypothetical protein